MEIPRGSRERWPPGRTTPAGSRPASALLSGRAAKRAGSAARGLPTWAMPAPISPPPMTVTCLTRIFFAEAAAVDEEDMERTNCLVTKAMVQTAKAATATRPGREDTRTRHRQSSEQTSGGGNPEAPPPARPWRRRDVFDGGAEPRGPLSPLAEASGTAFERPNAASKPTWTGAGRSPLQSR